VEENENKGTRKEKMKEEETKKIQGYRTAMKTEKVGTLRQERQSRRTDGQKKRRKKVKVRH
jgi:hypothetical protein